MNTLSKFINPYVITQLRRGETRNALWASYNCPSNGCLTNCLHLFRNVSVTSVRILIAEVICGLEYIHTHNMNFPNLSPETIYISHRSHIILTDFGFVLPPKDVNTNEQIIYRTGPLCYAPPEFLLHGKDDQVSDWWRLGVLIYHLLTGHPPFMGHREQVCQRICKCEINTETFFEDENLDLDMCTKDLVVKLLSRDRKMRLGAENINDILHHSFFKCIWSNSNIFQYNWNDIRCRTHEPAPMLRHLATRVTDSPRETRLDADLEHPMHSFNDWKVDYDALHEDDDVAVRSPANEDTIIIHNFEQSPFRQMMGEPNNYQKSDIISPSMTFTSGMRQIISDDVDEEKRMGTHDEVMDGMVQLAADNKRSAKTVKRLSNPPTKVLPQLPSVPSPYTPSFVFIYNYLLYIYIFLLFLQIKIIFV